MLCWKTSWAPPPSADCLPLHDLGMRPVEYLPLSQHDTHVTSARDHRRGNRMPVVLGRAIICKRAVLGQPAGAVVVRMRETEWLNLAPRDTAAALEIGYSRQHHWAYDRIRFCASPCRACEVICTLERLFRRRATASAMPDLSNMLGALQHADIFSPAARVVFLGFGSLHAEEWWIGRPAHGVRRGTLRLRWAPATLRSHRAFRAEGQLERVAAVDDIVRR